MHVKGPGRDKKRSTNRANCRAKSPCHISLSGPKENVRDIKEKEVTLVTLMEKRQAVFA